MLVGWFSSTIDPRGGRFHNSSVGSTPTRREPRRSKRLVLSVPVHVFGQDIFVESFNEFTRMISVSAHGGSLALAARVEQGQRILVVNKSTGEEQECRVVNVGSMRDGKWTVGITFVEHVENFWKIHFPAVTNRVTVRT